MSGGLAERARGALTGLALGDALGMPTQSLDRQRIAALYGRVDGLLDASADQPVAPGMPAGSVTDDTEQAMLVARLLIDNAGHVEPREFADALVRWERDMAAKGSRDLLGPSTKAAVDAIATGGEPATAGAGATTNGAAMRITPVALAVPPEPADVLLAAVHDLSYVTHNTRLALSAAAAVAGAVSAGVEGASMDEALDTGTRLAERAESTGVWVAGASVPARTRWARRHAAAMSEPDLADFLVEVVGTSVQAQESVVTALLIADRFDRRPYDGLCLAARLGGDTDTIAAIAGAVLGAVHGPDAFPADAVRHVAAVSGIDLAPAVTGLLDLRAAAAVPPVPVAPER